MRRSPLLILLATLAVFPSCQTDPSVAPEGRGAILSPKAAPRTAAALPEFPSDPAGFIEGLTNPYLAFTPGRSFRYEGQTDEGVEVTLVEVLKKTKHILGVATTVVRDRVYLDGELIEDTFDWYAEDRDGNVWYFGETTREFEDGQVVSTAGSWMAGADGAMPGIVMLADPRVGTSYHQEFAPGVAEDMAKVLGLSETVSVPYGTFDGCLQTQEWTPLDPGKRESKYYAPGVGLVLETSPGGQRMELVSVKE